MADTSFPRRRLLAALCLAPLPALSREAGSGQPLVIGFDSEVGHAQSTSDDAIRLGISAAIQEINREGGVLGRQLRLNELDNRSLPARGIENMLRFIADPNTVAVFGGKYSPVVLATLPHAREASMPLMVPWSAADAITRGSTPNVAFRIGLTDSMAMAFLVQSARKAELKRPALFAPRNAWGRSCAEALQQVSQSEGARVAITGRYWHNRGDTDFLQQLEEARAAGADYILGVLNEAEGAGLVQAISTLKPQEQLPVFSHWGVTGGDFPAMAGPALNKVQFHVVVTALPSRISAPRTRRMLDNAAASLGLPSGDRFTSAAGFMHAYDLTYLLREALRQAKTASRPAILRALEGPIAFQGLVKQYRRPFPPPHHEALGLGDLQLAEFDAAGVLTLSRQKSRQGSR